MGPQGALKVFPWSPDDCRFIYTHQGPGAVDADYERPNISLLSVCNANTGEVEATLPVPRGLVAGLSWLSPTAFIVASAENGRDLFLAEREADGWQTRLLDNPPGGTNHVSNKIFSMAAISSNAVIWLQGNSLWTINIPSNKVHKWMDLPISHIFTAFDYSEETQQFLLSSLAVRGDADRADSLWRLALDDVSSLQKIGSVPRGHDKNWNDASWINGARQFACISDGLRVHELPGTNAVTYFPGRSIEYFAASPDGRRVFVVGDVTNQPGAGIWEFNLATKQIRPVIAASEQPLQHVKHVTPQEAHVKLPAKKSHVPVVIYPPVGFDPAQRKKYPIVLASIRFSAAQPYISQYGEAIANAGAYFVVVDSSWDFRDEGIAQWESIVYDFHTHLLESQSESQKKPQLWSMRNQGVDDSVPMPTIDKDRIFIMSISAQSRGLMNLLKNHPGLCQGVICLVPAGQFPEPAELQTGRKPLKMLVTTTDGNNEYLKKYKETAWKSGLLVDYVIHPGAPHAFIAGQSQRERIRAMLNFITTD
jgi:dienelactone hydrolase